MIATLVLCALPALSQASAPRVDPIALFDHPGLQSGAFDDAREDWLAMLESEPASAYAGAIVREVRRIDARCTSALDPARILALSQAVADPLASLNLRRLVRQRSRELRFSERPYELPNDLFADFARAWEIAGPLGSVRDPAPLLTLGESLSANDPSSEAVRWHRLERERNQLRVRPSTLLYPGGAGLGVLRTELEPREGDAQIEIWSDARFRAYWNGQLVAENRRLGAHRREQRFVGEPSGWTPGVAGTLTVFVEMGEDPLLTARLIPNAPRPAAEEELPQAARQILAMLEDGVSGRADRALAVSEPDQWVEAWLRARHLALSATRHLRGEVVRRLELDIERRLDELGARYPEVEARRILRALGEDRPEEVLERTRALALARPDDPLPARNALLPLLALDVRGSLARPHLLEHVERFPEDVEVLLILADQSRQRGDHPRALELAWRALQLDGSQSSARDLVLQLGELAQSPALEQYERGLRAWLAQEPGNGVPQSQLIQIWQRSGRPDELEAHLRQRLAQAPHMPGRTAGLASFLIEQGRREEALELLETTLALAPGAPGPLESRALLGVADPAEEFFAAWAHDADEALAAGRASANARSDSVLEALDGAHVYVHPDGTAHWRTHTITLVANRRGTDELSSSPVLGAPRRARVLQPDGATLEPAQVDDTWVWPELDPGDAVELVYDRWDMGVHGHAPQLGTWRFASFLKPFVRSRLVVYLPPGVGGSWREFHFDGRHEEHAWGGGTVHVWSADDMGRREEEPGRPSYEEILPWIAYGEDLPVEHALRGAQRALEAASTLSDDLRAELAPQVLARVGARSGRAAAESLYELVQEHLLEFEPGGDAIDAWTLRRGDPHVLLAALLELAGMEYEWALVERPFAPELDPEPLVAFAGQRGFQVPCLRIPDERGEPIWVLLLPGAGGSAFGTFGTELAGARVRVLPDREEELPRSQLAQVWNADLDLRIDLDPRGDAVVTGRLAITGAEGAMLREQLARIEPGQRHAAARGLSTQNVPGLDLSNWDFPDLAVPGAPFVLEFEGRLPGYLRSRGLQYEASLRLPALGLSSGLGPAQRSFPLVLRNDLRNRIRITLRPGRAWSLAGGPSAFAERRQGFRYELKREEREEGVLHYERTLVLRGLRVAAEEMPAFLERLGQLEREELRAVRVLEVP